MARTVDCIILKEAAEGLPEPPLPGELGERIYENVSAEGWRRWLERQQMIINENQLTSADPDSQRVIEQHMLGFLFGEGDSGGLPTGFRGSHGKR